ncbi:transcriptional regulator TbsP domain-containing protein [Haloparvum sp. AD34]
MVLTDEARDALSTASDLVVADPDLDLLEAVLDVRAAAEQDAEQDEEWRLLLSDDVADILGYEFVLGTRVEERRQRGGLLARRVASPPGTLIATPDAAFAVAGPPSSRTLLSTTETADAVRGAVVDRFETAQPVDLGVPDRRTLLNAAERSLSTAFAADLDVALRETDRLHRSSDVNVLTLLVALGARHGHLFGVVRTWAEEVGIAPRQLFSDEKRTLVDADVIETIKLPLGKGHPRSRLQLVAEEFGDCPPGALSERLEARLQGETESGPAATEERVPVWKRTDRSVGPD